ncbi:MAG: Ppx/GppA family phosphatase [Planktotalea sp.]|uniref:Ppx/GppA family phosphatase n=1 Tax=Planktotalea sp. TaxID=2029877 RepID=UPI003C7701E1
MNSDTTSDAPQLPAVNYGPFGRPLFNDPSVRKLARVGVVDIGSNSVRMVVFDGAARSPAYFYNEKVMCALGAGIAETGRLNPLGRERALAAVTRFEAIAQSLGISPLTAVATAAVRDASDGPDFCADVLRETGLKVHVIDGPEEARLSAQGVLLGWPGSYGLVCDIGGASMELAEIRDGRVGKCVTSSLGPLKLQSMQGGAKARKAYIKDVIADLCEQMGEQKDRLFLVGGSWRAIARIDMHRRNYPLHVLHEYRMTPKSVRETVKFIQQSDIEELRQACDLSSARMALVPIASEVLKQLVSLVKPTDIAVSSYGIREGMLYEQMPTKLRDRDPLIESARFSEAKDARMPGFGKTLYDFIMPLFKSAPFATKRMVKAASLLHDVSWRAHPDYRAEVCFDNSTRANLGGLSHEERVFLGLALMHRYRNQRKGPEFEALFELISQEQQREAIILGKAMRFGAMLWMEKDIQPGEFRWYPKKKQLELRLHPSAKPLFSEVAESRLASLAASLEAEVTVKFNKPSVET